MASKALILFSTIVITIFLSISYMIVLDFLIEYFYSIGLADSPPNSQIGIGLVMLLPVLVIFATYLAIKFSESPKKVSIFLLKIAVVLIGFGAVAFLIWTHFVPQIVPQLIIDDTQKSVEEKNFYKVIFRYRRIAELYPNYATKREFKIAQLDLDASVLNSKDTILYAKLAEAYKHNGNYDKAIEILKKAVELNLEDMNPKNAGILYENLGLVYYDADQLDNAVNVFKKAIEYDPRQPTIYINLGAAYEKKGMIEESITQYRIAIQLDSKNALAHNNLGYALARKGNIKEAIAEFKKALILDPELKIAQENLSNYQEY